MTTAMPVLETDRLRIRPFVMGDLQQAHHVLCRAWGVPEAEREGALAEREQWLRWTVENYEGLANLWQPPYGDRAIELESDGRLIGSAGLVPALGPFGQLPEFPANRGSRRLYPELGLFWAVDPAYQGHGYATEAGRALIDYAFDRMQIGRVVATTEYENAASIAVMRKLGMEIMRNPFPDPEWFQVVGVMVSPD